MRELHTSITTLLRDLEVELRKLEWWQPFQPSAEALASLQPFCMDTLSFSQWLQFVFISRMDMLIAADQPLPVACAIAPMGEEAFAGQTPAVETLLQILKRIDKTLSK
ncbi:YqcC family protein [Teredinibacter haidensis]|uniref:YqcC family protein n=1 Tax=Teredinibacter haidensis TaxID=2731755 RepID=UPI0009489D28|nr:YqcC family protein [Teredinibacter haidensis]